MFIKGIVVLVVFLAGLAGIDVDSPGLVPKPVVEPGVERSGPAAPVAGMREIRVVHKACGESSLQQVWPGRYNTVGCPHCGRLFLLSPQGVDKSDLMEPAGGQGPTAMTRP